MKCPKCDIFLAISERKGIEIDYCPQCRGVWLDRGELDKIIANSNDAPNTTPNFRYDNENESSRGYNLPVIGQFDEYKNRKKKRKSMWDDLFDF